MRSRKEDTIMFAKEWRRALSAGKLLLTSTCAILILSAVLNTSHLFQCPCEAFLISSSKVVPLGRRGPLNHDISIGKDLRINSNKNPFSNLESIPYTRRAGSSSLQTSTALNGIRGFRSWFESQFPNAMTTIEHPRSFKSNNQSSQRQHQSSQTQQFQSETFHHVLIDMNQLLHVTLRRSRTEGHALTLLIQELDKCIDIAIPLKSVVLAFDGPPAAAKLATQRRRRYGTVIRAERKKARLELLKRRGVLPDSDDAKTTKTGKHKKRAYKRRRDKAALEEETLKITPGTQFMDRAHEAVLYWAWQRLDNPKGKLSRNKCQIYISPSTVPGEGEVKLLDWLIQAGSEERVVRVMKPNGELENERITNKSKIVKPGESVAILGGDSDLVLEGLVIPPTITHNVFVILPAGGTTSYVISLWETTLTLGKYLGENFDAADIMRVRTDLVLLLIMNGNDYLPKLRGSAGFNKLFHTYLRLLRTWLKEERDEEPYLVNPDGRMEFNLPFCIAYFQMLANMAPRHLAQPSDMIPSHKSITPLSQLYSMVDAGFLPQPAEFERIAISGSDGKEILRLVLGKEGSQSQIIKYDLEHRISTRPLKKTKQILANMALEDLLGKDYMDLNDYYVGNSNDEDEANVDDDDFDWVDPIEDGSYSWEIDLPAKSSVYEYLKGLLWNLATYQDGVCSDYGYNYGRRMSPTAEEVMSYFEEAQDQGRHVDRASLLGNTFVMPLNAGLSCLAALPSQVDYLIPHPYQQLSANNKVEDIFGRCMDPENNVFDIALFEKLCNDEIGNSSLQTTKTEKSAPKRSNLRKIRTGDTFWTVINRVKNPLIHPFEPPEPFSDRLSYLRFNPRIKSRHIVARSRPRWLQSEDTVTEKRVKRVDNDTKLSDMGELLVNALGDDTCLADVGYKTVYQSKENNAKVNLGKQTKKNRTLKKGIATNITPLDSESVQDFNLEYETIQIEQDFDMAEKPLFNTEKFNALQCLQQLNDSKLIRELSWDFRSSTKTIPNHAHKFEEISLSVKVLDQYSFKIRKNRNINTFSRKLIKHSMASDAMAKIFEKHGDWSKMTMKDLRSILSSSRESVKSNEEDQSALQCIHHLRDRNCFEVSWDFRKQSETVEVIILRIKGRNIDLILEESRNMYQNSKSSLKRRLAARAMEEITQDIDLDWTLMTISELTDHLTI